MQRALLQFFKPENYFEVRRALEQAGRQDLIGSGCDCLIPRRPPKEALDTKRREATRAFTERPPATTCEAAGLRGRPRRGERGGGPAASSGRKRPGQSSRRRPSTATAGG